MRRGGFSFTVLLYLAGMGLGAPSVAATITTITLTSEPHWVTITDVNGDGHLDLVAAATDSEVSENWQMVTVRGYGNGTFYPAQYKDLALNEDVHDLTGMGLGFASGDTYPDVFFITQNPPFDKVYRLYGNGDGTFGSKTGWNTGEEPESLQVFDRNGDGLADVAYVVDSAASSNTLGLRCGNSTGG